MDRIKNINQKILDKTTQHKVEQHMTKFYGIE